MLEIKRDTGTGSGFWCPLGFAVDLIFTGETLTLWWGCGIFLPGVKQDFGGKAADVSERALHEAALPCASQS